MSGGKLWRNALARLYQSEIASPPPHRHDRDVAESINIFEMNTRIGDYEPRSRRRMMANNVLLPS